MGARLSFFVLLKDGQLRDLSPSETSVSFALSKLILLLHIGFCYFHTHEISNISSFYEMFDRENAFHDDPNPCRWTGITCDLNNSYIVKISSSDFGIAYLMSLSFLCNIDTLESMYFSKIILISVPDQFFSNCVRSLKELKMLDLSINKLYGTLPRLDSFDKLEFLDLYSNRLSRDISFQ